MRTKSTRQSSRGLGTLSVAAALVSVHYGSGFVLGTGEKAVSSGILSSVYAVSAAFGIFALLTVAKTYWQRHDPLWVMIGSQYGKRTSEIVGWLSWVWMIGMAATQVVAAVSIVHSLGTPAWIGTMTCIACIVGLSLLALEAMGTFFKVSVVVGFLGMCFVVWRLDAVGEYFRAPWIFVSELRTSMSWELLAAPLATILITVIAADCHQYVVGARSVRAAVMGCAVAGVSLLVLAFLPSVVVIAGMKRGVVAGGVEARAVLPNILAWAGGGRSSAVGMLLLASMAVSALGSGAGLFRASTRALTDLLDNRGVTRYYASLTNVAIVLALAISGASILELVISFYCIYVAGASIPFLCLLFESRTRGRISEQSVYWSSCAGGGVSLAVFTANRLWRHLSPEVSELWVLGTGMVSSAICFIAVQASDVAVSRPRNVRT
jgi:SSS family solute:Na+ symporter